MKTLNTLKKDVLKAETNIRKCEDAIDLYTWKSAEALTDMVNHTDYDETYGTKKALAEALSLSPQVISERLKAFKFRCEVASQFYRDRDVIKDGEPLNHAYDVRYQNALLLSRCDHIEDLVEYGKTEGIDVFTCPVRALRELIKLHKEAYETDEETEETEATTVSVTDEETKEVTDADGNTYTIPVSVLEMYINK